MGNDEPAPMKTVLGPIAARLGLGGATETATVWRRWADLVGDGVAAHAEPTSLRDGVLRIRTDSSVWATEIGYLVDEIRRRINAEVGSEAVREVRIWTGARPAGTRPATTAPRVERAPPEAGDRPDPRAALERAHAAWEKRRKAPE